MRKAKKATLFMGVAGLFLLVAADVPAAECAAGLGTPGGLVPMTSGAESGDSAAGIPADACTREKTFHLPAAVPLVLSAIAGLGIVAFRGKPF